MRLIGLRSTGVPDQHSHTRDGRRDSVEERVQTVHGGSGSDSGAAEGEKETPGGNERKTANGVNAAALLAANRTARASVNRNCRPQHNFVTAQTPTVTVKVVHEFRFRRTVFMRNLHTVN